MLNDYQWPKISYNTSKTLIVFFFLYIYSCISSDFTLAALINYIGKPTSCATFKPKDF